MNVFGVWEAAACVVWCDVDAFDVYKLRANLLTSRNYGWLTLPWWKGNEVKLINQVPIFFFKFVRNLCRK